MSFVPAIVPEGTLLYHGGCSSTISQDEPHWLAFEIPHAEHFADRTCELKPEARGSLQQPDWMLKLAKGGDGPEWEPGYLHNYQASRDMRLVYIDGMAAASTDFGTLDSQDLVLLGNFTLDPWDEGYRAGELCQLAAKWKLDGFIRMEAGFEIIKCDISDGVHLLDTRTRAPRGTPARGGTRSIFEHVRDVSTRYNGIASSRVTLDYSSTISAYFYPVNLTNVDPKSTDPRLLSATPDELARIRFHLGEALTRTNFRTSIDWQGVVDMIQMRYSERLRFMADDPPLSEFLETINALLNTFIDYSAPSIDPVSVCANHYLLPNQPSTESDHLIHAAIHTVTYRICSSLFSIRKILFEQQSSLDHAPVSTSLSTAAECIQTLMAWLDWPDWKACATCPVDEVCFVAMFPFGSPEDHFHPACRNRTTIGQGAVNYWYPKGRPFEGIKGEE